MHVACCRWLWQAAVHEPWTPTTNLHFPPAFKAAACALLLAAYHSRQQPAGMSGRVSLLQALPQELLLNVTAQAAYPLSVWKPVMKGGNLLEIVDLQEYDAAMEALDY